MQRCPVYIVHVMSKTAADKVTEARMKGRLLFSFELLSNNISRLVFLDQVKLFSANLLQQAWEPMDRSIFINAGAMQLLTSCHHLCVMIQQQVLILWIFWLSKTCSLIIYLDCIYFSSGSLSATGTDNCTFNANQKALGKDDFRKVRTLLLFYFELV